jgi:hypothetical protein
MANTLDADLIVDVLSTQAMTVLNSKLAPLNVFSTDFSNEPVSFARQKVQVELVTSTGSILTNPTDFEQTSAANSNVEVTLNHYSRPVGLSAVEMSLGHKLMTKAQSAANLLANTVLDVCTALITEANYTNPPVDADAESALTGGKFDVNVLKAMWSAGSNFDVKNAVLDGSRFADFLPSNLESFNPMTSQTGIYGFDRFTYHNRFAAAGSDIVAFVCDPGAMAIAGRAPANVGYMGLSELIKTTEVPLDILGMSVWINEWVSTKNRAVWFSYDVVFGAALGDPARLTVVKSAY